MNSEAKVLYHWRVLTTDGTVRVWAKDERDAGARVERRGITPLDVKPERRRFTRRTIAESA